MQAGPWSSRARLTVHAEVGFASARCRLTWQFARALLPLGCEREAVHAASPARASAERCALSARIGAQRGPPRTVPSRQRVLCARARAPAAALRARRSGTSAIEHLARAEPAASFRGPASPANKSALSPF